MKIKFIKEHPAGIAEGAIVEVEAQHGERLIAEGYAEEIQDSSSNPVVQNEGPKKGKKK